VKTAHLEILRRIGNAIYASKSQQRPQHERTCELYVVKELLQLLTEVTPPYATAWVRDQLNGLDCIDVEAAVTELDRRTQAENDELAWLVEHLKKANSA